MEAHKGQALKLCGIRVDVRLWTVKFEDFPRVWSCFPALGSAGRISIKSSDGV